MSQIFSDHKEIKLKLNNKGYRTQELKSKILFLMTQGHTQHRTQYRRGWRCGMAGESAVGSASIPFGSHF